MSRPGAEKRVATIAEFGASNLSVPERSKGTVVLKITILAALRFGERGRGLLGVLPCRSLSVRLSVPKRTSVGSFELSPRNF